MNLADKISIVTGEPDAAEEILGLTAEEANLLSDPLADLSELPPAEDLCQSTQSAQLDKAIPSGRIAHIPAVDRQIDFPAPAKPVDVIIGNTHVKNPA